MATTTTKKENKGNFFVKVGQFFKRIGLSIYTSVKEMIAELKKVTWPTKSALINYTLVVLAFIVAMGIVVFVIDSGAAAQIGRAHV